MSAPQFTGDEDWSEVYAARPNKVLGTPIEVSVVAKRCVYVNDYRIAGSKPYFSENLPSHSFTTTLKDVIDAFREEQLLAALAENKAQQEYFAAYRAARDASAKAEASHD